MLTLTVPPLRDRREDILPLARMFLGEERGDLRLSPAAVTALESYAWPGNVRELQNAIKHGAALSEDGVVDVPHLPEDLVAPRRDPKGGGGSALRPLAEVEHDHIVRVLEASGGSQVEAARVLGIGRNTLWRKLRGS
ncbi:MAG: helix-turn-helix domain-containing protein [Polyangiaceae bacterium]